MALSLSNAKILSGLIDGVLVPITRRGCAAVSQGVVSTNLGEGSGGRRGVVKAGEMYRANVKEEEASSTELQTPDPVSGYYRPDNDGEQIDVFALREMLMNRAKQH